jgi:exodeoxyribonuclease V alpha subunit
MPVSDGKTSEALQVSVTRVLKFDEESGFTILAGHRVDGSEVKVIGTYHENPLGQSITAHGTWEQHETRGAQFRAGYIEPDHLSNPVRIASYLASMGIPGVGEAIARRITDAFGPTTLSVLDNNPSRLREVPRVTEQTVDFFEREWRGISAHRDLALFLIGAGVSPKKVPAIRETFGFAAEAIIRKDPYILARSVPGFGFDKADAVAQALGVERDDPIRRRALIDHLLQRALDQGVCGLPRNQVIEDAAKTLSMDIVAARQFLDGLVDDGALICAEVDETEVIYLPRVYQTEVNIARKLAALGNGTPRWGDLDPDAEIARQTSLTGFRMGKDQTEAVRTILSTRVSVMTGGPGVGKTTTLKTALDILRRKGVQIKLCAPTGMASKRMVDATGQEASTIHGLLEVMGDSGEFKYNSDNPLEADLIVVDESSMTDIFLCDKLLDAISRGTAVLFVGDVDQLPSVGPGRILHDFIVSDRLPVSRLTEVFRQGQDSMIIQAAHAMNRGEMPPEPPAHIPQSEQDFLFLRTPTASAAQEKILKLVCERVSSHPFFKDDPGFDPIRDILVVAPMKMHDAGVEALNVKIRAQLNPLPKVGSPDRFDVLDGAGYALKSFGKGDKVMNTVNRKNEGVMNGDIGFVREIDPIEKTLFVEFDSGILEMSRTDARDLQLAYAMTVHKCQGAEAPVLIMPVVAEHKHMLQRNLVYTGLTRAKKLAIMVGREDMLEHAISNTDNRQRWSYTAQALRETIDYEIEEDLGMGF